MLYYYRIDLSKRIDPAKSNSSKGCMVCHDWCLNHKLKYQDFVCNGCHDFLMLRVNISHFPIIAVKCIIIAVLFMALANLKQLIY